MRAAVRRYFKRTDISYLLICFLLSAISVVTLFSVGQYGNLNLGGAWGDMKPAYTQIFAVCVGLVAAVVMSLIDYHKLVELWPIHVGLCWFLVLLTFIPGIGYEPAGTGSQSWISLPLGMSFQPTEIAKISFCITFANHLDKVRKTLNRPLTLLLVLLHLAAPVLLIHFQGDDGGAMVFLFMGIVMLIMAGVNRWYVAGAALAVGASAPLLWRLVLSDHQKSRILGLLDPEPYEKTVMHQQLRGRVAIGSGKLYGRGLFQPDHYYVPRSENDFIFSYYAESTGFVGCMVLLALLFSLIFKILKTAFSARDAVGSYICMGIFAAMLFQTVVNLCMNLMLLPVMGVTLPFMSAGGTSVMMLYLSIGLVMSVGRKQEKSIFETV